MRLDKYFTDTSGIISIIIRWNGLYFTRILFLSTLLRSTIRRRLIILLPTVLRDRVAKNLLLKVNSGSLQILRSIAKTCNQ